MVENVRVTSSAGIVEWPVCSAGIVELSGPNAGTIVASDDGREGLAVVSDAWTGGLAVVSDAGTEGLALGSDAGTGGLAVESDAGTEGLAVVSDAWTGGLAVVSDAGTGVLAVVSDAGSEGLAVVSDAGTEGLTVGSDAGTGGLAVESDAGTEGLAFVSDAGTEGDDGKTPPATDPASFATAPTADSNSPKIVLAGDVPRRVCSNGVVEGVDSRVCGPPPFFRVHGAWTSLEHILLRLIMLSRQHLSAPPGRVSQPCPPHLPHSAAQHCRLAASKTPPTFAQAFWRSVMLLSALAKTHGGAPLAHCTAELVTESAQQSPPHLPPPQTAHEEGQQRRPSADGTPPIIEHLVAASCTEHSVGMNGGSTNGDELATSVVKLLSLSTCPAIRRPGMFAGSCKHMALKSAHLQVSKYRNLSRTQDMQFSKRCLMNSESCVAFIFTGSQYAQEMGGSLPSEIGKYSQDHSSRFTSKFQCHVHPRCPTESAGRQSGYPEHGGSFLTTSPMK